MLTRPPRNNDAYALADLIVTASVIDCYQPQTSLAVKSIPFYWRSFRRVWRVTRAF